MVAIKIYAPLYVVASLALAAHAAPTPSPSPDFWSDIKSYLPATWNPFSSQAKAPTTTGLSAIEQERIFMEIAKPQVRTALPPWPKPWLKNGETEEQRERAFSPVVGNHQIVKDFPNIDPNAPLLTPEQLKEYEEKVKKEKEEQEKQRVEREKELQRKKEREEAHEKKMGEFYLARGNFHKLGMPGAFPSQDEEEYVSDGEYETASEPQPEKPKEEEKPKPPNPEPERTSNGRRRRARKNKKARTAAAAAAAAANAPPSSPRPRAATPHASFFHHSLDDLPLTPARPQSRLGFRSDDFSAEDEERTAPPARPQSRLGFRSDDFTTEDGERTAPPPRPHSRLGFRSEDFSAETARLPNSGADSDSDVPLRAGLPTILITPPSDD